MEASSSASRANTLFFDSASVILIPLMTAFFLNFILFLVLLRVLLILGASLALALASFLPFSLRRSLSSVCLRQSGMWWGVAWRMGSNISLQLKRWTYHSHITHYLMRILEHLSLLKAYFSSTCLFRNPADWSETQAPIEPNKDDFSALICQSFAYDLKLLTH